MLRPRSVVWATPIDVSWRGAVFRGAVAFSQKREVFVENIEVFEKPAKSARLETSRLKTSRPESKKRFELAKARLLVQSAVAQLREQLGGSPNASRKPPSCAGAHHLCGSLWKYRKL